jgi:hypothetical protein
MTATANETLQRLPGDSITPHGKGCKEAVGRQIRSPGAELQLEFLCAGDFGVNRRRLQH